MSTYYFSKTPISELLWYLSTAIFFVLLPLNYGASKTFIEFIAIVCLIVVVYNTCKKKAIELERAQVWLLAIILFYAIVSLCGYLVFPSEEASRKYYAELKTIIVASSIILVYKPANIDVKKMLCCGLLLFILCGSGSSIYDYFVNDIYRPGIGTSLVIPTTNVLVIATILCWAVLPKNIYYLLIYLIAASMAGCAIIISGTKGAWLNLLSLTFLLGYVSIKNIKAKLLGVVILIIIIPFTYFIPHVSLRLNIFKQDIEQYSQVEKSKVFSSSGFRLIMWDRGIRTLVEDPFSPRGLQRLNHLVDIPDNSLLYKENYKHAHNEIMQQWLQKGLAGLFAIILLLAAPLLVLPSILWREGLIMTTGAFVAGLTDLFLYQNFSMLFYLITLAILQKYVSK